MKRSVVFLAMAGAALLVTTACAPATIGQPAPTAATSSLPATSTTPASPTGPAVPYGTLRVARPDFGNESFDPNQVGGSVWGWILYDPLITWDAFSSLSRPVAK